MLKSFKSSKRTSNGNGAAQQHIPGSSLSAMSSKSFATEPPKKIIRALYDYRPQGPGELKFQKGDFLYVTGSENSQEWYEAYDPPSNMRGVVPVSYFEVVSRKDTIPTVPINSAAAVAAANQKSSNVSTSDPDSALGSSKRSSSATNSSATRQSTTGSSSTGATSGSSIRHSAASNISTANAVIQNPSSSSSASFATGSSTSTATPSMNQSSLAAMASRFSQKAGHSQLYGVVMYDFVAERSDELSAVTGESIIIIAKSNDEWFVAKPIGRLGGPGLIPISFIEVRDIGSNRPVENLEDAIIKAKVPKVEEWKRMAAEYKASSIPLGKVDEANVARLRNSHLSNGSQHQAHAYEQYQLQQQQQMMMLQQQQQMQQRQMQQPQQQQYQYQQQYAQNQQTSSNPQHHQYQTRSQNSTRPTSTKAQPAESSSPAENIIHNAESEPHVVSACVDRYYFADDRYWYLVIVELSNGRYRHLCRYYQDFYDFQVNLLDEFPEEAGRAGKARTLPFMPGPLTYVNDSISSQRRANLDEYVRNLIKMPEYISKSPIVRQLFAIRTGDIESSSSNSIMPEPPIRIHRNTPEVHEPPPASSSNNRSSSFNNRDQPDNLHSDASSAAPSTIIAASEENLVVPDTRSRHNSTIYDTDPNISHYVNSSNLNRNLYPDADTSAISSPINPADAFNPKHSVHLEKSNAFNVNDNSAVSANNNPNGHVISRQEAEASHVQRHSSHEPHVKETASGSQMAGSSYRRSEHLYLNELGNSDSIHKDDNNLHNSDTLSADPVLLKNDETLHGSRYMNSAEFQEQPAPEHSSPPLTVEQPQQQNMKHSHYPESRPGFQETHVKIKVFHEDDLIAIRVSNAIPFEQLSAKIAERLGLDPSRIVLLYKDSNLGEMVELHNSQEFLKALGNKLKLVLCAR